ncbi:hypothetical protein LOK49_LG08G00279 [Camellia lanceoleosa]|uniref:Uncharacterized protein n=1 Tax=Camellia lanceoleosa TaxID=1840588 RepID=A0ACC0GM74_9ERIC|nr:hypothetical protein LOK49_LG08G00279 [Camellia lanceoleosa]
MESLGKEFDLDGSQVNQGLTVYGNKGSTDQHACIQQLRKDVHSFFVMFIEVLCDRPPGHDWELEPGVTCSDYLFDLIVESMTAALKRSRTTCFAGSCRSIYMLDVWFGFIEINANLEC